MLFKFFALATSVSFAAAWTKPTGNAPEGNPVLTPGLTSVVPVGEPYSITWTPTTNGTVTLLLLKGPSTNAVPQYAIVEHIANSGSYSWTPATDLAPGKSGYGIELIDDATGQYQYSTQFGISNDAFSAGSTTTSASASTSASTSASASTDSATSSPTTSWSGNSTWSTTSSGIVSTTSTSTAAAVTTTSAGHTSTGTFTTTSHPSISISTSASTAAATATPATGAAANVATSLAGLVFAAGVAVFAL